MPKVSVVIPTHNRPDLIGEAIQSVLNQTYQDFEIIVVDDGLKKRAEEEVRKINDKRIIYIKHEKESGGSAARNTGIRAAQGSYIAFLDDDDRWVKDKLQKQIDVLENMKEVGWCLTAVENIYDDHKQQSHVPAGVRNYYELALRRFKGFLTSGLVVRREIFEKVGLFDETLPSHQEVDVIIRIAKDNLGFGIDSPMVIMNVTNSHDHIGSNMPLRIKGREIVVNKYMDEFKKRPGLLAFHFFWLGLMNRDLNNFEKAREYFSKSFVSKKSLRCLLHYVMMLNNGFLFKLFKNDK